MEHERWMQERRLKQPDHPDLVPWEELKQEEKEKDIRTIKAIPEILGKVGLHVVRLTADAAKMNQDLPQEPHTAHEISDESVPGDALSEIARAQVAAGKIEEALKTVREISDESVREWALIKIAEAQAAAGKIEEATPLGWRLRRALLPRDLLRSKAAKKAVAKKAAKIAPAKKAAAKKTRSAAWKEAKKRTKTERTPAPASALAVAPESELLEFVRKEVEHVRKGKHGARSAKQAIATGLSKARRAGVKLAPTKKRKASPRTRRQAERNVRKGRSVTKRKPSSTRSRATSRALRPEGQKLSDQFRFSVFYPDKVPPEVSGRVIAYGHLESAAVEVVRDAARRIKLTPDIGIKAGSEKPSVQVPKYSVIKVTPDVPGLLFDILEASMSLWEDMQSVEFRFRARPSGNELLCRGWVHFWLEGMVLADVAVAICVAEAHEPDIFREALAKANARPYRTVFPSYSHDDAEIVGRMEAYAAAFGDEYLRDVRRLRAGQCWNPELMEFIKRADVFQLFWSQNAADSAYVEQEWRQGLQERVARPDPYFVRPVYWTTKPSTPIPKDLEEIHFTRVPL
jgi:hypothetical protein